MKESPVSGPGIELQSDSVEEAVLSRIHGAMVPVLVLGALPLSVLAQGRGAEPNVVDAYHATVGRAFSVSAEEVGILWEWGLEPDEVGVVLFVASSAGISPDAAASLRTSGLRWGDILRTYSVDVGALWLSLPSGRDLGPLEETYRAFSQTPRASWNSIDLQDHTVVALVNLRILAREFRVPVADVLETWGVEGDFVSVHKRLAQEP